MEYQTERLTPDHLAALTKLHNQSFSAKHTNDYVTHKYGTSIFGAFPIGYFAKNTANENAAYYGVFPININYQKQTILACQSGDTMTHPDHRGKGLFKMLAQKTYQTATEENIALVFGFTNSQSHPGFVKLGWEFNGKWQNILLNTGVPDLSRVLNRLPFFKKYCNNRLSKYSINFEEQKWQVHTPNNVSGFVTKDANFFTYKKNYSQASLISFSGFQLFVKADGYLYIGDVSYFEEKDFAAFIEATKKLAQQTFMPKVAFQFSSNHWLNTYFINAGYQPFEHATVGEIGGKILSNDKISIKEMMFTLADADFF